MPSTTMMNNSSSTTTTMASLPSLPSLPSSSSNDNKNDSVAQKEKESSSSSALYKKEGNKNNDILRDPKMMEAKESSISSSAAPPPTPPSPRNKNTTTNATSSNLALNKDFKPSNNNDSSAIMQDNDDDTPSKKQPPPQEDAYHPPNNVPSKKERYNAIHIQKAKKFINHPSIQHLSTKEKIDFLKSKGLSMEEINRAFGKKDGRKKEEIWKEDDYDYEGDSNDDDDDDEEKEDYRKNKQRQRKKRNERHDENEYTPPPRRHPPRYQEGYDPNDSYPNGEYYPPPPSAPPPPPPEDVNLPAILTIGGMLGIVGIAFVRWLNGGDFVLFPPPSVRQEEEESEERVFSAGGNENEGVTIEEIHEEEEEEETEEEAIQQQEQEKFISNDIQYTDRNDEAFPPDETNVKTENSISILTNEVKELTSVLTQYVKNKQKQEEKVVNTKATQLTDNAMDLLRRQQSQSETTKEDNTDLNLSEKTISLAFMVQLVEVKMELRNISSSLSSSSTTKEDGDAKINGNSEKNDDEAMTKRISEILDQIESILKPLQNKKDNDKPSGKNDDNAMVSSSLVPKNDNDKTAIIKIPIHETEKGKDDDDSPKTNDIDISATPKINAAESDDANTTKEEVKKEEQPLKDETTAEITNKDNDEIKPSISALSKALQTLSTSLESPSSKPPPGINMLHLYLRNLSTHPTIPRYRKIYTNNATYKQNIETLKGGKEVLQSVGFEKAGNCLEWKDDGDEGKLDLVKDAVAALELLKDGKVIPPARLEKEGKDKVNDVNTMDDSTDSAKPVSEVVESL